VVPETGPDLAKRSQKDAGSFVSFVAIPRLLAESPRNACLANWSLRRARSLWGWRLFRHDWTRPDRSLV